MSLSKLVEIIRGFTSGADFDMEASNGQIHITHSEWNETLNAFLHSPEGRRSPNLAAKLEEIRTMNQRLDSELLDDPEPLEDALLQKCVEFLDIFQK